MSSVNGLLVPNNFDIYAKSINTPGGGVSTPARELYSGGDTNTINIGDATNPTAGQVLTATDANTAEWQTPPSESVSADNSVALTNKTIVDGSNTVAAKFLICNNNLNTIDISTAPGGNTPGKILVTTSSNTASWQEYPYPTIDSTHFVSSLDVPAGGIQGDIATFQTSGINGKYFMKGDILSYNTDNFLLPRPYYIWMQWTVRANTVENLMFGRSDPNGAGAGNWSTPPFPVISGTSIDIRAVDTGNNVTFKGFWTVYYESF